MQRGFKDKEKWEDLEVDGKISLRNVWKSEQTSATQSFCWKEISSNIEQFNLMHNKIVTPA
jgi:hypothetical protein